MASSLYEKLGGEAAVNAAVELFYQKVTTDESLKPFFEKTDMNQLKRHQKAFMAMAFGGPKKYSGQGLRKAHAHLVEEGLGDAHFDAVAGHLKAALEELKVSKELIQEVLQTVGGTRNEVLNR